MNLHLRTLLILSLFATRIQAGPSTLGEGDSYAWGANTGWIQLIPDVPNVGDGVAVSDSFLAGYGWSANTGWINFGDGTPGNGIRYGNTDGSDSGVNQDGAGNLSGLAWSANLGWINFGWWSDPDDSNRPRFNLLTGDFSGYAWSANTGWISLNTGILKTDFVQVADSDADGISDTWELDHAANLGVLGANSDADDDGASDVAEYQSDTDPQDNGEYLHLVDFTRGETSSNLKWTSQPTRVYRINQSTTLSGWTTGNLFLPDAGDQTSKNETHPVSTKLFFSVESVVPLQQP